MGNKLDTILIKQALSSPITVNTTYFSPVIEIDDREDEFIVQTTYNNGTNVDMSIHLLVSADNVNYARVTDTDQTITDNTGSHIYDVAGTGATYMKIEIEVRAGSIDLNEILYKGKRRH